MKVSVKIANSFKKRAKPLLKNYVSLFEELIELENKLQINPRLGSPLGANCFKIRLSVKSKNKGKSGGLRVISMLESEIIGKIEIKEEEIIVYLISIYDKAETATITNKELSELISLIELL